MNGNIKVKVLVKIISIFLKSQLFVLPSAFLVVVWFAPTIEDFVELVETLMLDSSSNVKTRDFLALIFSRPCFWTIERICERIYVKMSICGSQPKHISYGSKQDNLILTLSFKFLSGVFSIIVDINLTNLFSSTRLVPGGTK